MPSPLGGVQIPLPVMLQVSNVFYIMRMYPTHIDDLWIAHVGTFCAILFPFLRRSMHKNYNSAWTLGAIVLHFWAHTWVCIYDEIRPLPHCCIYISFLGRCRCVLVYLSPSFLIDLFLFFDTLLTHFLGYLESIKLPTMLWASLGTALQTSLFQWMISAPDNHNCSTPMQASLDHFLLYISWESYEFLHFWGEYLSFYWHFSLNLFPFPLPFIFSSTTCFI